MSDNYLLGDDASRTYDAEKDTYPTSRPVGNVTDADGKLYPFKYTAAYQPMTDEMIPKLIAMDTYEYLKVSGNVEISVEKGLVNMGLPDNTPYKWVTTDTYQLINHGIDEHDILRCNDCHANTHRMDLKGELGYELKGTMDEVCTQCHKQRQVNKFKSDPEKYAFYKVHNKHVEGKNLECSNCHNFSRPERNLKTPQ